MRVKFCIQNFSPNLRNKNYSFTNKTAAFHFFRNSVKQKYALNAYLFGIDAVKIISFSMADMLVVLHLAILLKIFTKNWICPNLNLWKQNRITTFCIINQLKSSYYINALK